MPLNDGTGPESLLLESSKEINFSHPPDKREFNRYCSLAGKQDGIQSLHTPEESNPPVSMLLPSKTSVKLELRQRSAGTLPVSLFLVMTNICRLVKLPKPLGKVPFTLLYPISQILSSVSSETCSRANTSKFISSLMRIKLTHVIEAASPQTVYGRVPLMALFWSCRVLRLQER